jgi:hypothetical protein
VSECALSQPFIAKDMAKRAFERLKPWSAHGRGDYSGASMLF